MERAKNYILIDHIPVAVDCYTLEGLTEWVTWMEDFSRCRVADDFIGSFWISTVFLGVDQRLFAGPPLLFRTTILENKACTCLLIDDNVQLIDQITSELDGLMWQYATWAEAKQGHALVVGMVRRSILKDGQWWEFVANLLRDKPGCR
ncbi:MAG: hypothetical protein C4519_10655 [Desulfobacteraceae bacterium]|nr:MAG: hypothetical protein C4519_10655 [Desulfobacteraceae bacterium]